MGNQIVNGRLVIAGTQSGVGKTTLTAGILAALRQRGLIVQPFKVGPDYIDPGYHTLAAGRICRNLDSWMLPPERVVSLAFRAAHDADLSVIEGVMGLYDGAGYEDESGSTAEVAKLLSAPVVVVLDAAKMARSAGAIALGYQQLDPNVSLAGFIINRVAGESHGAGVAGAVTRATGLPVLGWLPRAEDLRVAERHLGLVPTSEPGRAQEFVAAAAERVIRHLDVDQLLAIAQKAPPLPDMGVTTKNDHLPEVTRPVIAVARDEAFHFSYEDNLDLLRAAGAQLVAFSPLCDSDLPPGTAGVLLSGGFPELFAEPLAANRPMHEALRAAHRQGLPIYAECGGLMYLTEAILDNHNRPQQMVGLLPGRSVLGARLTLGYRRARAAGESWLLPEGAEVRGHEFHYSVWEGRPADLPPAWYAVPRAGGEAYPEGARLGSLWASYIHLHFGARPELADRFVAACRRISEGARA
jgi:cobyrinic acid a,c-diamide synthase